MIFGTNICMLVVVKDERIVDSSFSVLSTIQSASIIQPRHVNHQQKILLFYNSDIILLNFSFFKPFESIQTSISIASLHHQHATITL